MNRLPRGSSDEFLLENRPNRKKQQPLVLNNSKAGKGIKTSYQSARLSPEQKERIKDYLDKKGRVL